MLEFLLLALFSQKDQNFLSHQTERILPEIEALAPASLPQKKPEQVAPRLLENPATAVLAFDSASGKTLLEKHANRPQPIASLSKLMTALIILENHDLDEIVTIPLEATQINSSTIDVYQYEQMTVQTLLEASLIASANDAALALAMYHSRNESEFAKAMNERAKALGLSSAKFFNATGLDIFPNSDEEQKAGESMAMSVQRLYKSEELTKVQGNMMSTYDVLKLMRLLLKYDFVRETIAQDHFYGTSADEKFFHEKPSTNQLLNTEFLSITGGKTGFTYLAGECFVAVGHTPDGHEVITVLLGSLDRFGETKALLSWIYDSFEWK